MGRAISNRCDHPRVLICVDPGGVEIWRCPVCEPTGAVPWCPPRFEMPVLRGVPGGRASEDDPGIENAVRALEDGLSELP